MDRRSLLLALAAGTAGVLSSCTISPTSQPGSTDAPTTAGAGEGAPSSAPGEVGDLSGLRPVQSVGPTLTGVIGGPPSQITALPKGQHRTLAITIDDGTNEAVVEAYVELAKRTGLRLTFFVTAVYPSWHAAVPRLRPLVESGQIQLANHSWDHPDLTRLSVDAVKRQLERTERFLAVTYGVTGTPFYRPPFGAHNPAVRAAAAQLGYTTTTMWNGTLGDSGLIPADVLLGEARTWMQPQTILLGHANAPTVTRVYGRLLDLIKERSLLTVTLDDAYYGSAGRSKTPKPSMMSTATGTADITPLGPPSQTPPKIGPTRSTSRTTVRPTTTTTR